MAEELKLNLKEIEGYATTPQDQIDHRLRGVAMGQRIASAYIVAKGYDTRLALQTLDFARSMDDAVKRGFNTHMALNHLEVRV